MSKTGPKRFVLVSAAVMFAMIISVNSASPSSSRAADRYVYPKLAADGNFRCAAHSASSDRFKLEKRLG